MRIHSLTTLSRVSARWTPPSVLTGGSEVLPAQMALAVLHIRTVWSVSHAVDGGGFGGRFGGDARLCARAAPPRAPARHRCRPGRPRLAAELRPECRHRVRRA